MAITSTNTSNSVSYYYVGGNYLPSGVQSLVKSESPISLPSSGPFAFTYSQLGSSSWLSGKFGTRTSSSVPSATNFIPYIPFEFDLSPYGIDDVQYFWIEGFLGLNYRFELPFAIDGNPNNIGSAIFNSDNMYVQIYINGVQVYSEPGFGNGVGFNTFFSPNMFDDVEAPITSIKVRLCPKGPVLDNRRWISSPYSANPSTSSYNLAKQYPSVIFNASVYYYNGDPSYIPTYTPDYTVLGDVSGLDGTTGTTVEVPGVNAPLPEEPEPEPDPIGDINDSINKGFSGLIDYLKSQFEITVEGYLDPVSLIELVAKSALNLAGIDASGTETAANTGKIEAGVVNLRKEVTDGFISLEKKLNEVEEKLESALGDINKELHDHIHAAIDAIKADVNYISGELHDFFNPPDTSQEQLDFERLLKDKCGFLIDVVERLEELFTQIKEATNTDCGDSLTFPEVIVPLSVIRNSFDDTVLIPETQVKLDNGIAQELQPVASIMAKAVMLWAFFNLMRRYLDIIVGNKFDLEGEDEM